MEDKWWVSHFNYLDEITKEYSLPNKLKIYDVTLRDGEQSPGVVFRKEDKIKIAQKLDELGVQRIEGGMPVVSDDDKEAIKEIVNLGLTSDIWGFCRCIKSDVDACIDVGVDSVICEIATSKPKFQAYGLTEEKVLSRAVDTLEYAKDHGLYTAFFSVDMTRSDLNFLKKINNAALEEGKADELVLVDTLGVATPEAIYYLTKQFKNWFDVPLHIHCHNDFGLGTACELAAIKAGAEWAHTSLNGLGEKTGNTDLAELVLSAYILYGLDSGLTYEKLVESSKLIEKLSGVKVPAYKPVVGDNVFTRESGVTVLQLIRYPPAVEGYAPELVGGERSIVLGKKSGRHSINWKLEELGINASEEQIAKILDQVKQKSIDKKGLITDSEFKSIVNEVLT